MTERLGHAFFRAAVRPVNYAASLLLARQVQSGLAELTSDNLLGAVRRGIALVAARSGVPTSEVERHLPVAAIIAQAGELAAIQQVALAQWKRHAGHVGGLLEGVADLTIDGRTPDLALCLARLGKKLAADREWSKPLLALSAEAARWSERLDECRNLIDNGQALAQSFARRRLRRLLLACVASATLGLGGVIAVWYGVRVGGARARIDAIIARGEVCSWDEVAPSDRAYATAAQRATIDGRVADCTARRARERAEAEERERAARLEEERKRRLEKLTESCQALERALEAGKLTVADEATAGSAAALLRRVAGRKLDPADTQPPEPPLPCAETASAKAIGEAFDRAVALSAGAWIGAEALSDRARKALVAHKDELQLRHKSLFSLHADKLARRALVSGAAAEIERAKQFCSLVEEIGMRRGPHCTAMGASK